MTKMIKWLVANFNGITMAYAMAVINTAFAALLAFGVPLTDSQVAAVTAFLNACLVIIAHLGHRLGEQAEANATAVHAADNAG